MAATERELPQTEGAFRQTAFSNLIQADDAGRTFFNFVLGRELRWVSRHYKTSIRRTASASCRFAELMTACKETYWFGPARSNAPYEFFPRSNAWQFAHPLTGAKGQFEYALAVAVRVRDDAPTGARRTLTFPKWNLENDSTPKPTEMLFPLNPGASPGSIALTIALVGGSVPSLCICAAAAGSSSRG